MAVIQPADIGCWLTESTDPARAAAGYKTNLGVLRRKKRVTLSLAISVVISTAM